MKPSPQGNIVGEIGPYQLLQLLGEGSFGSVFEALDTRTNERVALKHLLRSTPAALARFKQEYRFAQDLHHPNLVALRELFEHDGRWSIAMELVRGTDLLSWVRDAPSDNDNAPSFDEARLREAFRGVAQGLVALHEHGALHRDLKPSNVRVTLQGRAVLLDFGLVTTLDPKGQSTQAGALGTAAYMAPEQALAHKVGPAADWYAFGVCLYEAVTGCLPFDGASAVHVMLRKQGTKPPPPSSHATHVPRDLEDLCIALLEPVPEKRATAREVLDVFGVKGEAFSLADSQLIPLPNPVFAGRQGEMLHLERALERTHNGDLSIVMIEGESGVGKSELAAEFLRRQRKRQPSTLVLKGRCYENEQVPFKAFDGCMDELAKTLRKLPSNECAALLPRRAALLTQLFPVLREVKALASAPTKDVSADPTARRLEAFAALAALLGKLASDRPLILLIDDLQWADVESFRLLRALVEGDRPPILLLCTVRPRSELEHETVEQLEKVRAWHCADVLPLDGLPREQACHLASELLGAHAPLPWLDRIAHESKGHPLFIAELARYASSHDIRASGSVTLDAALAARIATLSPTSRDLLELVALCGRPYGVKVFVRALRVTHDLSDAVKDLLSRKLLRTRKGQDLVCFHDRIRQVLVGRLASTRLAGMHRALAEALEYQRDVDPSELGRHWDGAGVADRALNAYERAADQALETLAFARADELYARAIDIAGVKHDEQWRKLMVQRGHALARRGRSADAARVFEHAAQGADGQTRVRLRVWAAQHLIQSAHVSEGLGTARAVLSELGVPLPEGTSSAFRRLLWDRACIGVRGLKVAANGASDVPGEERIVLDALKDLSVSVSWVEMLAGNTLNTRYLRRALDLGEPAHAARALAQEAVFRAMQKPAHSPGYEPLFVRSRNLVSQCATPELEAYQAFMEGTAALFRWDLQVAKEHFETAQLCLQTDCPGEPWLLTNVRMMLGAVWFYSGEHLRLAQRSDEWVAEARERDDRFALAALVGLGAGSVRHLISDNPDAAASELSLVMAPWPEAPFSLAHWGEVLAVGYTGLYREGPGLLRWFDQQRTRHAQAFIIKHTQFGKETIAELRGQAALAALRAGSDDERMTLLSELEKQADALRRAGSARSMPMAALILAQVHAVRGEIPRAREQAALAIEGFAAIGHFYAQGARYLEGSLDAGSSDGLKCEAALSYFRERGWRNPRRALALCIPAIGLLDPEGKAPTQIASALIRDRYEILRSLGQGGFGNVVEARDVTNGRKIALKELVRASGTGLARFKQEFRALQDVHHPNLARLEALFEHHGKWFIAMELVPGTDFLSWVRPPRGLDEKRLRATLLQLTHGLAALHEAGFMHRDLTPANIRVTPEGRIVLVDFGLVSTVEEAEGIEAEEAVGTAYYMAPEQTGGYEVTPAADVYSLGVCLYEALTGRYPVEGPTPLHVMQAKRKARPKPPSRYNADVPPDLERVCMDLLETDANARPTFKALGLSLEGIQADVAPRDRATKLETVFAGREKELSQLKEAFSRAQAGAFKVLLVEGESGLGKSALVSEFLRQMSQAHAEPLVLKSRCYENEQVPYKAFDGAMDELAKALRRRGQASAALLPPQATLLAQLFPVLGSVRAIAEAPRKGLSVDPTARRLEAFSALRSLLRNLARVQPLVIVVDDMQWADGESFRLLRAFSEGVDPPRILVVCTVRGRDELDPEIAQHLDLLSAAEGSEVIRLDALSRSEARTLAAQLFGVNVPPSWLDMISEESRGHPLFLRELVHYARHERGGFETGAITLEAALITRIGKLDVDAQRLLTLVALTGRPHSPHLYSRALQHEHGFDETVTTLLASRLVRARRDQALICAHDRIRHEVLQRVKKEDLSILYAQLASALEAEPAPDSAELARYWDYAGNPTRAVVAYERAADSALETLAFARAEHLFGRALSLLEDDRGDCWRRLMVQRAQALARGGRGAEAACVFQQASDFAEGEQRVRLRVLAAQQMIQSAQVEEGMNAARSVLADLGVPVPKGNRSAIAHLLWDRTCLALRGLDTNPQKAVPDHEDGIILDALSELSFPVAFVDLLPGSAINHRHLRLALKLGQPAHVARALAQEASLRSLQHPDQLHTHSPLFERSRNLARSCHEPGLWAHQLFMEGMSALFRWELCEGERLLMEGLSELETNCPGHPWLLTQTRQMLGMCWMYAGEHARLADNTQAWLAEALEREDHMALVALSGIGRAAVRYLVHDRPEAGLEELGRAMARWPQDPFSFAHFGEACSVLSCLLYIGGAGAFHWLEERTPRLNAAIVLKAPFIKDLHGDLRAMSAMSALSTCEPDQWEPLVTTARREAASLARRRSPFALPMAALIRAQLLALDKQYESAWQEATVAREGLAQVGLVHAHAAAYLEGLLEGGNGGAVTCRAALSFFASQGWKRPDRAIATFGLPAIDLVAQSLKAG